MTNEQHSPHGLLPRQVELLRQILVPFAQAIIRVDLFGSRAGGQYRNNSDIDIVIHGSISEKDIDRLHTLFQESSLPFSVDVKSYALTQYSPLKRHMDMAKCVLFTKEDLGAHAGAPLQKTIPHDVPVGADLCVCPCNHLTFGKCAQEVRNTIRPEEIAQVPYIGLEHIEQNTLHLNDFGTSTDVKSIKSAFSQSDILFGKLRPYFRKVVLAPFDGVCSTDIWVVRAAHGIEQRFLFYWMASKTFIDFSMQGADGTKMPRAKWEHVSRHQIPFVSLPEQRAIAHILGSLDDKIALNRRMNATLEDMAQALFKSWFVDFDPVIDKALAAGNPIPELLQARAAVRAALGNARRALPEDVLGLFPDAFEHTEAIGWVPKGWDVQSLDKIAYYMNGLACQKYPAHDNEYGLPVIKIRELRNGINEQTDSRMLKNSNSGRFLLSNVM